MRYVELLEDDDHFSMKMAVLLADELGAAEEQIAAGSAVPWHNEYMGGQGFILTMPGGQRAFSDAMIWDGTIYLSQISVENRASGLGTQIMEAVRRIAVRRHYRVLVTKVTNHAFFDRFDWLTRSHDGSYRADFRTIKEAAGAARLSESGQVTVKLTDLYDEQELTDPSEMISSYVDEEDWDRDFVVHTMTPAQARTYKTPRDDMTVYEAFRRFAGRDQKRFVRERAAHFDHDRIIVTMFQTVIDGNHHIIAGIMAKQPIRYINLADPKAVQEEAKEPDSADGGSTDASKEELRAAAADVMKRMGVTPVVHWYEGTDDDLDKGMHIPGTGVMYLNSRTLSSVADARGVTAHESMHHKFSKALQQYDAEKQAGRNGPAHAALWTFLEGPDRDKLRKAGGVSSYSQKAWRQAALRPDLLGAERSAHHETLAEIARLKEAPESVQGTMKVKPIWQRYFAAVNRLYRS